MNENEMLQAILNEIKGMNARLDRLEDGQKALENSQRAMNARLDSLEEGQKAIRADVEDLKEGQKAIRRDVARVDRKIDRLSADVGDTLVYITENVGTELDLLKKAR